MADGPNVYLYVRDDPVNRTDFYGLWGVWFGGLHLGNDRPWLVFDKSSWFDLEKGAYSTIDGFIPFSDPFKDRYENDCGYNYKLSGYMGAAARDILLVAGGLAAAGSAGLIDTAPQANNIIRVISKPGKWGFRLDKAHHGKWWGHPHFWKW